MRANRNLVMIGGAVVILLLVYFAVGYVGESLDSKDTTSVSNGGTSQTSGQSTGTTSNGIQTGTNNGVTAVTVG